MEDCIQERKQQMTFEEYWTKEVEDEFHRRTHDRPSVHRRVAKEIWDMAPERVYVCPFCDLEYAKASGARTCCR